MGDKLPDFDAETESSRSVLGYPSTHRTLASIYFIGSGAFTLSKSKFNRSARSCAISINRKQSCGLPQFIQNIFGPVNDVSSTEFQNGHVSGGPFIYGS